MDFITAEGSRLHPCSAAGCVALIPKEKLLCGFDWRRVPRELQLKLNHAWAAVRAGAGSATERRTQIALYRALRKEVIDSLVAT